MSERFPAALGVSRKSAGEVIITKGSTLVSSLNFQLTQPQSILVIENPTGPSSICPVERVVE
jgi:hypothetical protein